MHSRYLTILVPGLLGPFRGIDPAMLDFPDTPGLAHLLDMPVHPGPGDYESAVRACFDLAEDASSAQAAVGFLADHDQAPDASCLCASPVHLRVETDYLLLYDDTLLALQADEAAALAADFNRYYNGSGLYADVATPSRWYLTGLTGGGLETTPLRAARARSIGPLMPAGPGGPGLRALMNEIQMLFHDHPVNQARAERGQPAVSGLWLWGEGTAPTVPQGDWQAVWANDPWVRGLARLGNMPADALLPALPDALPEGPILAVLDGAAAAVAYSDPGSWTSVLATAERDWFAPAWQALRTGRLSSVEILPADGRRFAARRRWPRLRKPKPLSAYL